jgi:chromosome partitioning protein
MAWSSARESDPLFPVVGMAKPTLHRDLPRLAADYEFVVIDGAPRVNELARSAILASDLVLIPVQPSPYDIWAAAETVRLVREARQMKPGLAAAFVVNRMIARTAIGRDAAAALKEFEDVPVLAAHLNQRVVYAESAARGLAVIEAAPMSEAARELKALVNLVLGPERRKAA